mmetsp:Transcript_22744/g.52413  ORF Transcript_22744/g.52413 Transcript_22744/m.52413 type:complete len:321 (+) Transcript_22744:299-1261(+)
MPGADGDECKTATDPEVCVVIHEKRQAEHVRRVHEPEHVRDMLVQDQDGHLSLPPTRMAKLLQERHLQHILILNLVAHGPQVDARVQHIHRDEGEDDASRPPALVIVDGGIGSEEVDPAADGSDDDHRRPILDNGDRDLRQVSAGPTTDVLAVQEVIDEILGAGDHREALDGANHEEQLVGSPDIVHGQERDLVRIHTLHDAEPHAVGDDQRVVQDGGGEHEAHHADVVEVEGRGRGSEVHVEADPEERGPEPHPVRQVVEGDDQAPPPLHLIRKHHEAPASPAHPGEEPQDDEAQEARSHPYDELQCHVLVDLVRVRVR